MYINIDMYVAVREFGMWDPNADNKAKNRTENKLYLN